MGLDDTGNEGGRRTNSCLMICQPQYVVILPGDLCIGGNIAKCILTNSYLGSLLFILHSRGKRALSNWTDLQLMCSATTKHFEEH